MQVKRAIGKMRMFCSQDFGHLFNEGCLAGAVKHLVQYFKKSTKAMQALKSVQIENHSNPLQLLLDVPTRWNSTLEMIDRLCLLQSYVRQVLSNTGAISASSSAHLDLSGQHWLLIQNLVKLLEPIKVSMLI